MGSGCVDCPSCTTVKGEKEQDEHGLSIAACLQVFPLTPVLKGSVNLVSYSRRHVCQRGSRSTSRAGARACPGEYTPTAESCIMKPFDLRHPCYKVCEVNSRLSDWSLSPQQML